MQKSTQAAPSVNESDLCEVREEHAKAQRALREAPPERRVSVAAFWLAYWAARASSLERLAELCEQERAPLGMVDALTMWSLYESNRAQWARHLEAERARARAVQA